MEYIETLGLNAKNAAPLLARTGAGLKNEILAEIAKKISERKRA